MKNKLYLVVILVCLLTQILQILLHILATKYKEFLIESNTNTVDKFL